jgi:N-acetyl-alpha-D-glucosaminyl L-malate synthase BshA
VNPLRIGISCFSTSGGSGVIAAEVGMSLARRGHQVHVISDDVPGRLDPTRDNVAFHRVAIRDYPSLKHSPYTLALASKMIEVARQQRLDLLHVHYAVPHAASAYLARQVLGVDAPRIVTTLHGTDITLVGVDPSFLPLTRFAILQSDGLTVPSAWLRETTYRNLDVPREVPIEVIANFVDTDRFCPAPGPLLGRPGRVVIHVSNFRPLKRVGDVVEIFARLRAELPIELRLVGDGPDRPRIEQQVRALGLGGSVHFLGEAAPDLPELLRGSDLFLLPSQTESFGLAALEAMSCGVPVVASDAGGISEVVTDGEVGFLAPVGDVAALTARARRVLTDDELRLRLRAAARRRAESCFPIEPAVARYEAAYRRLLAVDPAPRAPFTPSSSNR